MWITQNVSRETTHIGRHIPTKSKYILRKKIAKYRRKQIKNNRLKAIVFSFTVWRKRVIKRIRSERRDTLESSRRSSRQVSAGVVNWHYIDATHAAWL